MFALSLGFAPPGGPYNFFASGGVTPDPDPVPVEDFVASVSRTIRILPGQRAYDAGSFWSTNGNSGPVGSKDPNATIDIRFEWAAWLADIGAVPLANISFILGGGLTSEGVVPDATGGTIFVAGGTVGVNGTVTCRVTTATEPARIDDRTATLQIKDQ